MIIKKVNKLPFFLLSAAFIITFISCGTPVPENVSFTGRWNKIFENSISGDVTESPTEIITDGTRFRIEDNLSINVYDGTYLYTKSKPSERTSSYGDFGLDADFFKTRQKEITPEKTKQYMFWLKKQGKKKGPGGNIAGQDTILYTMGANRPDGEIGLQSWVDAETGIVLKFLQTIYSRQIEQMVSKESFECIQIDYGYVDDSAFNKPE